MGAGWVPRILRRGSAYGLGGGVLEGRLNVLLLKTLR